MGSGQGEGEESNSRGGGGSQIHTSSHCSPSRLADCPGIRKEVEDWEKVHWEPPSTLKSGVTKSEKKSKRLDS